MEQTRLKQLREEAVLTVHELAEASGVSDDTISKIENGQRVARPSTLRKLASALNVRPQELRRSAKTEELATAGKVEAPGEAGPSLLDKGLDAARQDEQKTAQTINRLHASEGELPATNMTEYAEDKFRAELRALRFPDEQFEDFIWPLVTTVNRQEQEINRQEQEISRLREENSRLREEAEQESVPR
jgi:transcriptional regulator with XRE-family HTH domain